MNHTPGARQMPRPKGIRRVERWLVGLAMAVVAFILERIVMRSVKKSGDAKGQPPTTTVISKGGEVDLE
jgi:hypothetical protein